MVKGKTVIINKSHMAKKHENEEEEEEEDDHMKFTKSQYCDTEDLVIEMELRQSVEIQTDGIVNPKESELKSEFFNYNAAADLPQGGERKSRFSGVSPLRVNTRKSADDGSGAELATPLDPTMRKRNIGVQTETFNFLKKMIERHSLSNIAEILKGEKNSNSEFQSPLLPNSKIGAAAGQEFIFRCEKCSEKFNEQDLEKLEENLFNQVEQSKKYNKRGAAFDENDNRNSLILNHFEKKNNFSIKLLGILKQKVKDSNLDDSVVDQIIGVLDKREFSQINSLKIGSQFVRIHNELQEAKLKENLTIIANRKLEIEMKDDNFELEELKEKSKNQSLRIAQLIKEVNYLCFFKKKISE